MRLRTWIFIIGVVASISAAAGYMAGRAGTMRATTAGSADMTVTPVVAAAARAADARTSTTARASADPPTLSRGIDEEAARRLQSEQEGIQAEAAQRSRGLARRTREHRDIRRTMQSSRSVEPETAAITLPSPSPPPPAVDVRTTLQEVATSYGPMTHATTPDRAAAIYKATDCEPGSDCPVTVFYATDRRPVRPPRSYANLATYYGSDRELAFSSRQIPIVHYGETVVTIRHTYVRMSGKIDAAATLDVKANVLIESVHEAKDVDAWLERVRNHVTDAANPRREVLVFIHGYRTTFGEAARRTAQIAYDLQFTGTPMFFSWPSGGGLLDYWADEASVEWSTTHLREFLDRVQQQTHAQRIHLIAHSMGNRALTRALAEIGLRNSTTEGTECGEAMPTRAKFSHVVMAAPDLDTDVFLQLKNAIQNASDHVTLYASRRDRAILISWILHRFRRLGSTLDAPPMADLEYIDATEASTDMLGHSYYGQSILWDVRQIIACNALAGDRSRLQFDPKRKLYRFHRPNERPNVATRSWRFVRRTRLAEPIDACLIPAANPLATVSPGR